MNVTITINVTDKDVEEFVSAFATEMENAPKTLSELLKDPEVKNALVDALASLAKL